MGPVSANFDAAFGEKLVSEVGPQLEVSWLVSELCSSL